MGDFPEDSQTSETILRNKRGDRQVEKSETAGDLIANIREGVTEVARVAFVACDLCD